MLDAVSLVIGAILGVSASVMVSWWLGRPYDDGTQDTSARLSCDACEKATFTSADAARKHAIRYHSAIDAGNWQSIISEV